MNREQLSALMDGELNPDQEASLIAQWGKEGDLPRLWNDYHLIGDVLRENGIHHTQLGERVSQALAQEPTVLAPQRQVPGTPGRWLAVAAAVSAVAISTWTFQHYQAPSPVLASSQAVASARTQLAQVPAVETKAYVAMHRQWSPISGFQTVDYADATVPGR